MASKNQTIAISGYYGFNNSGDEAVLLSILTALERAGQAQGVKVEPVVLSGDPATTTRLYGVRAVHRMKPGDVFGALRSCDGLISGGGSLLQDATSAKTIPYYLAVLKLAQMLGKPTFIYAQGVGPVQKQSFYAPIRHVFSRAAYVSVRDEESAQLLNTMGIARSGVNVVPDPVMGLRLPEGMESGSAHVFAASGENVAPDSIAPGAGGFDEEGRPYVGVSVRFWNKDRSDMDAIAAMLNKLAHDQAVHIRFLPFHGESDKAASQYIMDRLALDEGRSVMSLCPPLEHPQAMLAEVSRCRILIGMRLHSLIYAASQEVPMLGISYDPKIDQFLHRLGLKAVGSTQQLDADLAAAQALNTLVGVEEWRISHHEAIVQLKRQAEEPAQQVVQWLSNKR
ncbi:polysaccharide pyruvyl transferase CsaB [Paenibacillus sp. 481]|uniref:polysaccharide pyruvyl transferase CsaB n=1 Tax=Paenibacillus sp. 481 TaxID=2835869 RepID=UPI001E3C9B79|nr:polysaccharide pyruvyl transferase CsaB [Paenibacillus sp. 481]UHA75689.1 polysaccharide pyruvyl transferase CsaB [Paenibacillus sp. 481]